jgi:hypothetical protein
MLKDFRENGWKEGLLAGAFSTLGLMLWQLGKSVVKGMKDRRDNTVIFDNTDTEDTGMEE